MGKRASAPTRDAPPPTTTKKPLGVKDLSKFKGRRFGVDESKCTMFIRQWRWKREMKSDRERFEEAYEYPSNAMTTQISLKQRKYSTKTSVHGFASTVWDSSIVLAKYVERTLGGASSSSVKTALELGSGCGLVSCVLSRICQIPTVVATDLEHNLDLLRENLERNAPSASCAALEWGKDAAFGNVKFDLVVASDVVYVEEAMPALVETLKRFCAPKHTRVVFAYGRNRQALETFLKLSRDAGFSSPRSISKTTECDELWTCTDVDLIELELER